MPLGPPGMASEADGESNGAPIGVNEEEEPPTPAPPSTKPLCPSGKASEADGSTAPGAASKEEEGAEEGEAEAPSAAAPGMRSMSAAAAW